jgi:hypothetical protein
MCCGKPGFENTRTLYIEHDDDRTRPAIETVVVVLLGSLKGNEGEDGKRFRAFLWHLRAHMKEL